MAAMEIEGIVQGTEEWLALRRNLRMASETPAIMGLSSYQTAADVRAAKRGKSAFVNAAMRNGSEQEPVARAAYEAQYEPMRPAMYVDGDYGCSLDGINIDGDTILEVKTPYKDAKNSERWQYALRGEVPPADYAQIQHQLMVCPAAGCHFWVWDHEAAEGIMVPVEPNPQYWETIKAAWDAFWPTVQERDDEEWAAAANLYLESKLAADSANAALETAKKRLTALAIGDYTHGRGVAVKKVSRAGAVDWKKVQADHLKGVDVEAYRKAGTEYFTVEVEE